MSANDKRQCQGGGSEARSQGEKKSCDKKTFFFKSCYHWATEAKTLKHISTRHDKKEDLLDLL